MRGRLGVATGGDYIRSGLVAGLDPSTVRGFKLNGLDAASARAGAEGWQFDVTVVRVGNRTYRLLTAEPTGGARLEAVASSVRNSFRVLSEAERASLKPLVIRIVTVRPGDTPATIAAAMQGTDRKLELFRILNGLTATSVLQPGTKVKIVTAP